MDAATSASQPVSSISLRLRATVARMKLNSPTCEKAAATGQSGGHRRAQRAHGDEGGSGLPTMTTNSTIAMGTGALNRVPGSKSMPTETKNSTANASRIGMASMAARAAKSVRPTASPARNAPSSMETPKIPAAPTAMPTARTSTASVNSSRERVRSIFSSAQGTTIARARPP